MTRCRTIIAATAIAALLRAAPSPAQTAAPSPTGDEAMRQALRTFGWEGEWAPRCNGVIDPKSPFTVRTVHAIPDSGKPTSTQILTRRSGPDSGQQIRQILTVTKAALSPDGRLTLTMVASSPTLIATSDAVYIRQGDKLVAQRVVLSGMVTRHVPPNTFSATALEPGQFFSYVSAQNGFVLRPDGSKLGPATQDQCK